MGNMIVPHLVHMDHEILEVALRVRYDQIDEVVKSMKEKNSMDRMDGFHDHSGYVVIIFRKAGLVPTVEEDHSVNFFTQ